MVSISKAKRLCVSRFIAAEEGTISVDWAVMAAVVAALAIASADRLSESTTDFENAVEATLKNNVSNVEATSTNITRSVGTSPTGDDDEVVEFGFAGINSVTSTTSSRVQCRELVANCGRSAETITEQFLMNDGAVWTRSTTTYTDDGSEQVVWLDDTGRETSDVPDLPEDIPVINF
jgi:Flp pilus assembly pilin Flp